MGYIKKYKFEKLLLLPVKLRFSKKKKISEPDLHSTNCHFIIFYAGAIGDCVLATYFVAALKKQFPQCKVTFIGIPAAVKLLDCFNEFDYLFENGIFSIRNFSDLLSIKVWKRFFKDSAKISDHVKNIQGYKVLISLTRMDSLLGVYKTRIIASSIKNNYSIGLNSNNGRGRYFDDAIFDSGNLVEHITKTWSRILSQSLKLDREINPELKCTVKNDVLINNKIDLSQKYCVIHTGGGSDATQTKWISKRWSVDNFYQLANWLYETYQYKVVFVGTLDEKDLSFNGLDHPYFIDLYGKTSLAELIPLFKNASVYIGNDSGLAHIASFTGVKTFVIWGYPSYIDYAPIANNTQLIRLNLSCAPCLHIFDNRLCKGTDWEFKCIKGISVENVKKTIHTAVSNEPE